MSYTHYFRRPVVLDEARFRAAVEDVKRLLQKLPKLYGYDGTGEPEFSSTAVVFNGDRAKGEHHETFCIRSTFNDRHLEKDICFSFCKTVRKPYDLAVMATLLAFKHRFGSDFRISSDGGEADWKPGFDLVREVLGYAGTFGFDDEGNIEEVR